MGKSIEEWKAIIKKYETIGLEQFLNAFDTLETFTEFNQEYKGLGLSTLRLLVNQELDKREGNDTETETDKIERDKPSQREGS